MFRIGDHIVAVRDHSIKVFRQGDEFVVSAIRQGCCRASVQLISIGIKKKANGIQTCPRCGTKIKTDNELFFSATMFAPLLDLRQAIEELMLEPVEL